VGVAFPATPFPFAPEVIRGYLPAIASRSGEAGGESRSHKIAVQPMTFTLTLFGARWPFLQEVAAVFPDYTVSAKLTIQFRVSADRTICQALVTVAIFPLFTIQHCFSFWMKAAAIFVHHGERNLLKKCLHVKTCLRLSCPKANLKNSGARMLLPRLSETI
jgi:hypothetical protein